MVNIKIYDKLTIGERHLVDWQLGISGGFFESLFACASRADDVNLQRLQKAFPEEIIAFKRFRGEKGYWTELEKSIMTEDQHE